MFRKIVVYIIGLAFLFYRVEVYLTSRQEKADLHSFLEENALLEYEAKLHKFGILSKAMFARLDSHKFLTQYSSFWGFFQFSSEKERLEIASQKAKQEVMLLSHLRQLRVDPKYFTQLLEHGINSIEQFNQNLHSGKLYEIFELEDLHKLQDAVKGQDDSSVDSLPMRKATTIFSFSWWASVKFVGKIVFYTLTFVLGVAFVWTGISRLQNKSRQHQTSIFQYVFGLTMEPKFTSVTWEWKDPYVVGESMSFVLKFYRMNLAPYPVSPDDYIFIEIMHNGTLVASSREYGGHSWTKRNALKVSFTVREAGTYRISILARGVPIRKSPFTKTFLPGSIDPSKCVILEGGSLLEVQQDTYTPLTVEARDKFGNICPLSVQDVKSYSVEVTEIGSTEKIDPELVILPDVNDKNNVLHIKIDLEGCFNAVVKYNGVPLSQGQFTVISLNSKDAEQVDKNIKKQCWNVWYEAHLLTSSESSHTNESNGSQAQIIQPSIDFNNTSDGGSLKKSSKVYCYISRKQLSIKEFYMRIIPHRLYGFRVKPTTKITLHPPDHSIEHPAFTVDDGSQPPVTFMCKERNVLVATFSRLLLSKIGGSESFNDKKDFFYRELVAFHGRKSGEVHLKINRQKLLESSYQATVKSLYSSDWLRLFTIIFKDELGVDWGGLRREWFELLCKALFAHENGFFTRFNADDPQALVHPNPRRPGKMKLKFYEFAGKIVGKCLYESALGSARRQNVKARFSRSFLAQLLGLRVCYRYFESDDKDLYRSKIKYIEETDPEDLGLVFAEEVYNQHGHLEKLVELKPGGGHIAVTESNKKEYLDLLAQYRLSSSVKQEIEAFSKGLNELVPVSLLSIFDEYELELLMCGTGNISVTDFRQHHSITDTGILSKKSLDWFWTIVTSFTQGELARLVQFITGSSQLPPGGFAELSPQIQISSAPTMNALPSAHTCFNQLCLPAYSSFNEMQKKLLLAINEGSEGFAMV
ncbi:apoptosis-resistant E3 ubiquitin protein ligase 1-like isoform X1 [Montipora capricornis]|uniref:apoptosis-resistant E3 ubiquitin protein ligase 1-like isoform X1 n=2 Tax=Montipora capricornis TaxID=246305 RepID=UPI0035F1AAD2